MEGLDFFVEHMTWKRLPKEVFEPLGGLAAAKALRLEQGFGMGVKKTSLEGANAPVAPGDVDASGRSTVGGADAGAAVASNNLQHGGGVIESKEGEVSDTTSSAVKLEKSDALLLLEYDLGKKWFSGAQYEGFGAENVDTIEKSRKRLRAEAFGGDIGDGDAHYFEGGSNSSGSRALLSDKKIVLKKDLPLLLPKSRLAMAARKVRLVPNVVWNLQDGK